MISKLFAGFLVVAGMIGLYFKIDYSGFILFIGLIAAFDNM